MSSNAWTQRFDGLDEDEIRRKATLAPQPIENLQRNPRFHISEAVAHALCGFYIPSDAEVALLMRFVDVAKSHCWSTYRDRQAYLKALYTPYEAFETEFTFPVCLTGHAGVGKTALLAALSRVMPASSPITLGKGHPEVQSCSHWNVQVRDRTSPIEMLRPFIRTELEGTRRISGSTLSQLCAKSAHRTGVSLITIDEMQFLTQSATASTMITKALYRIAYLGVPLVFAANHSLYRLLMRREEQDRQRLLATTLTLSPFSHDSEDWHTYLRAVSAVLGKSFKVDVERDSFVIYQFTAGLKRLVIQLVAGAYTNVYAQGRSSVHIEDVANAFGGTAYTSNRNQVKDMLSADTSRNAKYASPVPTQPTLGVSLEQAKRTIRDDELRTRVQQDVMTSAERERAKKSVTTAVPAISTAKPAARRRPRQPPLSAQEMLDTDRMRTGKGIYPKPPPGN